MENIGIVGLGNMGMGMAKNLLEKGFSVFGHNRSKESLERLAELGGQALESSAAVGARAGIVFVMVVNAGQTRQVVASAGGLLETMRPGSVIVVTATIGAAAIKELAALAAERGVHIIDCPVSGGRKGAEAGQMTLMASGDRQAFDRCSAAFDAIARNINYVGAEVGMGQIVKACMQGLVGCIYSGIFESLVLGVKAGVSAEALFNVIGTSVANTPLFQGAVPAIMERKFVGTGSNIGNTYKDLTITLALAEQVGVPMMITGAAKQFFQAGISKFPDEDNQCLVKLLEEIVDVKVTKAR